MAFNKQAYDQKYAKENFDRIPLNVKKGEKDKILAHAKAHGFSSITEYIKYLIYTDMESNPSLAARADSNPIKHEVAEKKKKQRLEENVSPKKNKPKDDIVLL